MGKLLAVLGSMLLLSHFAVAVPLVCTPPCVNGGVCVDDTLNTCQCPTGYSGAQCEMDVDPCSPNPCGPNSGCIIETSTVYTCTCPPGFNFQPGGTTCEVNDACWPPCENGGICLFSGTDCDCTDTGFEGDECDMEIDECDDANCGVGDCIDLINDYECECPLGYYFDDVTCQDINECEENPDICGRGRCKNREPGYTCDCDSGYRLNTQPASIRARTCIEKLCCELPDPTYGKVRVKSRTDGSTAFYSCDRGYKLSGDKTRTCDDGDWRGEEPCCIVIAPSWVWPLVRGTHMITDGHDGELGKKGERGCEGDEGMKGLQGEMGDQGERGEQGTPGAMGGMGGQGGKGDIGDLGAKGMKGMDITSAGVVFTVWGQTDCPSTSGTSLLYQGRAATARRSDTGTGTNYLCLPDDPMFDPSASPDVTIQAYAAGVRYVTDNEPLAGVDNTGMPCSVCYSTRAVQLMIPGRAVCPDPSANWRLEYNGYLMSSRDTPSETLTRLQTDSNFRNEYICVSANAVSASNSVIGSNEAEVYHVHLDCVTGASLGCSFSGQLTCAMCTFELP